MNIHIRTSKPVSENLVKRIENISKATVGLYENILETPYGPSPDIHICDEHGYRKLNEDYCIKVMQGNDATLSAEEIISINKDMIDSLVKDVFYSGTCMYWKDIHSLIIRDSSLEDTKLSKYLTHELVHGHEKLSLYYELVDSLQGPDLTVLQTIFEGITDHLSFKVNDSLLKDNIITEEEHLNAELEKSMLTARYPSIVRTHANQLLPYQMQSLGYFYVQKKLQEGLLLKDVDSLLDNRPKTLVEMHREEVFI